MKAKYLTILFVFTALLVFSFISRIYFNDFQDGWNAYENKDYETARKLWTPLAEQSDSRAQFFMGFMHDMGFGVPEDDKEAIKWYQLAAEQGDSRAQLFTGYMHDFGQGIPEDDQKAFKWYQLAAEQGYKQAKINIYNLAKKNYPEALKVLTTDAENGNDEAQYALDKMYEVGQGVRQEYKEAVKWYQLAAEQGKSVAKAAIYGLANKGVPDALKILRTNAENNDRHASYKLAQMYEVGQGVRQEYKEAVKWYQLAAEQGYKQAKENIYNLAKKNSPEALKILVNDAENGSAVAQTTLSMMYQIGLGVPQDNHESLKWFRFVAEHELARAKEGVISFNKQNIPQVLKALSNDAENGDAKAQLNLGLMRQLGLVLPKDDKEAIKWFRLAADQGRGNAQFIMGLMYAKGQGVPQDDREAMKWYRLAAEKSVASEKTEIYNLAKQNVPQALKILKADAENGIADAQYYLGEMYANGPGVSYDPVLAHMWYNLSGLQGHKGSKNQIKIIEKKMSPQQIEQAQEMVRDWKPRK